MDDFEINNQGDQKFKERDLYDLNWRASNYIPKI